MHNLIRRLSKVCVAGLLLAGQLAWTGGCATLAHRSGNNHDAQLAACECGRPGEVCPWLVGDALLLIPGIVPGAIAFIVDFSTGEWRHPGSPYSHTVTVADEATD
jgi:hypothetical protein